MRDIKHIQAADTVGVNMGNMMMRGMMLYASYLCFRRM